MKSVLVVDDSQGARDLLHIILEENGFLPFGAASGEQALLLLQQMKFDLIISDLEMPEGDGHFLLKSLQQNPKAPKVIIVSGDLRADEKELILLGAAAFFRKPFSPRSLIDYVKAVT